MFHRRKINHSLHIMRSLSTFMPWSSNRCHEYLYPTFAACPSISLLKIVIIFCITSGLLLLSWVNPNLRNLFFKVLNDILRLWYAAMKFYHCNIWKTLVEKISNVAYLVRQLFWSAVRTEVIVNFNCSSFTTKSYFHLMDMS